MDLLSRLTDPLLGGAARARNRLFLEAAMASAALVASADGAVTFAKRHALDQVLDSVEALKAFDVHGAVDLFDGLTEEIGAVPKKGQAKALKAISAIAGQPEPAQVLVRIGCAIARADGAVSAEARTRIEEISRALGVPAPELGGAPVVEADAPDPRPWFIVLGNEKGGTGKSTTAMHVTVALLKLGHRVGSIDLDGRQGTLSHYVANRAALAKKTGLKILLPMHRSIVDAETRDRDEARRDEKARLEKAVAELARCRFVVIDTPGNNSYLARLGHAHADILITPLNDSFLDIDVLARVDWDQRKVLEPSPYCKMVWEQNESRVAGGRAPIDWIVMRNRLAQLDARNTREMAGLLKQLSKRMNFRLQPGFSERVIFRELFYRGLTLMDLPDAPADGRTNASHLHARQEVRDLLDALGVPDLKLAAGAAPRNAARKG